MILAVSLQGKKNDLAMTHVYEISGMTCSSCVAKVKSALLKIPDIDSVDVSLETHSAKISMSKHISNGELQRKLSEAGNYKIINSDHNDAVEVSKSWLATYKPILLIFAYTISISLLVSMEAGEINVMSFMRYFMAGFFISFSFFKFIDLKGFAESYKMYDVIAMRFGFWAFLYPFVELGLGISFLLNLNPFIVNSLTLLVMSLSIIGVIRSVIMKQHIQCACLGAVFNLPMSTVTIIEAAIMIIMSGIMLILI